MALNSSLVIHNVKPGECERVLDPAYQPRAMRSGLLSGIVLIFWWPVEVVRSLSQKLPTVSIMHKYPGTDVDMVGIDNEGGMEILIRELYNKGHRRIAFLGVAPSFIGPLPVSAATSRRWHRWNWNTDPTG
jgi:DNA-binding LacI/PurR family transcriptional regulator